MALSIIAVGLGLIAAAWASGAWGELFPDRTRERHVSEALKAARRERALPQEAWLAAQSQEHKVVARWLRRQARG